MNYTARKPFRYGAKVYMAGESVAVINAEEALMLQRQGKIGGAIRETASIKPPEKAVQPEPAVKVAEATEEVTEPVIEEEPVIEPKEEPKEVIEKPKKAVHKKPVGKKYKRK